MAVCLSSATLLLSKDFSGHLEDQRWLYSSVPKHFILSFISLDTNTYMSEHTWKSLFERSIYVYQRTRISDTWPWWQLVWHRCRWMSIARCCCRSMSPYRDSQAYRHSSMAPRYSGYWTRSDEQIRRFTLLICIVCVTVLYLEFVYNQIFFI
jgi:hypothetical protein